MEAIEVEIEDGVFLDCYQHLDEGDFDIELLWGSRYSGKTHRIGQKLLMLCMSEEYFRCILVKKTFESIKDAQWQTLKDIAEDWGVDHLFRFTQSPLSITCVNGNRFIARGFDKAEKIKAVASPNYCWVEEADQLDESDYIALSTTLRGKGQHTRVKQYLSFNPEAKTPKLDDFWLYRYFFTDPTETSFTRVKEFELHTITGTINVSLSIRATHTTYLDNPYVTHQQMAILQDYQVTNPYYYLVYAKGKWGQREAKRPFITALRKDTQVTKVPVFDPAKPVYVAMDFNIDPFAFIFAHHWQDKAGEHLHIFDEATIFNGSIHAAVEYLNKNYANSVHKMIFTGDPGGNRREFSQRDNASLYTTLQRGLKLRPNQLIVPAAPTHKNSREEVNYWLHHYPDFQVHAERCKNLVFDMQFVEVDEHSSIVKSNRSKTEQRADHFDAFRYLVNTFFRKWIYTHQKRR